MHAVTHFTPIEKLLVAQCLTVSVDPGNVAA